MSIYDKQMLFFCARAAVAGKLAVFGTKAIG